jgi:hypothetical protein
MDGTHELEPSAVPAVLLLSIVPAAILSAVPCERTSLSGMREGVTDGEV